MPEVEVFESVGGDLAQQREREQEPAETGRTLGVLVADVLRQHDLRLILEVLHLNGILLVPPPPQADKQKKQEFISRIQWGRLLLLTHLQSSRFLLEQDDGLEAGEFGRIDCDGAEALHQFV